jgi:aldehyde:ferredoxin oxidoreductase
LLLGGPDVFWDPDKDDDNPPRFYEPLPTGPYAGKTTDKAFVDQKKQDYYAASGWDNRGIPTTDTLKRLDLTDLEKTVKGLRK